MPHDLELITSVAFPWLFQKDKGAIALERQSKNYPLERVYCCTQVGLTVACVLVIWDVPLPATPGGVLYLRTSAIYSLSIHQIWHEISGVASYLPRILSVCIPVARGCKLQLCLQIRGREVLSSTAECWESNETSTCFYFLSSINVLHWTGDCVLRSSLITTRYYTL